jgi:hypothetical protein
MFEYELNIGDDVSADELLDYIVSYCPERITLSRAKQLGVRRLFF